MELVRIPLARKERLHHRVAGYLWLLFPTEWFGVGQVEPKDPHQVIITRRSDGARVATFDHHEYLLEAARHRDSIRERLSTRQIFDLCRELRVDMLQVGTPRDD